MRRLALAAAALMVVVVLIPETAESYNQKYNEWGLKVLRVAFADEIKFDLQQALEASLPSLFRAAYTDDQRRMLQL